MFEIGNCSKDEELNMLGETHRWKVLGSKAPTLRSSYSLFEDFDHRRVQLQVYHPVNALYNSNSTAYYGICRIS